MPLYGVGRSFATTLRVAHKLLSAAMATGETTAGPCGVPQEPDGRGPRAEHAPEASSRADEASVSSSDVTQLPETPDSDGGGGGCVVQPEGTEGGREKPEGMSKRQWKRRLKEEWWEKTKVERRQKQKEKDREKRQKRKLEGRTASFPPRKKERVVSSLRVAIELGYEDLMSDKDIKMLTKQCQRCYAVNRRAEVPVQLYLTSFGGRCKQRMDSFIDGYQNWDVNFRPGSYTDEFSREDIVFLAAESPNVLMELDETKVYIIGGLVDHNNYKGRCFKAAVESGVAHAQLPISQFVKLNSRKVLAVNHVFEILLAYLRCNNWETAFHAVIPQRKLHPVKPSTAAAKTELREDGGNGLNSNADSLEDSSENMAERAVKSEELPSCEDAVTHPGQDETLESSAGENLQHI